MRLHKPLVRLPVRFCAETLARETRALGDAAWIPHPMSFAGNDAALLVSPGGRIDQGFSGAMAQTPHLLRSSYIRQIMAGLGCTWGRSRLMRLAPGAQVKLHIDVHYYWRTHWRLHIPVVTNPGVRFTCDGESVHMAPGECWLFDSFRAHEVHNDSNERRVHLVLDTVGGGRLFDLLKQSEAGTDEGGLFEPDGRDDHEPLIEQVNSPTVMSPWEVKCHVADLLGHSRPGPALAPATERLDRFIDAWSAAWACYGERPEGFDHYRALAQEAQGDLKCLGADQVTLDNNWSLLDCLRRIVFTMAAPRSEQTTLPLQAAKRPQPVR